jgi:hypothetical protein
MKGEISNRTGDNKPPILLPSHDNYKYLDKNITEQLDHIK